MKGWHNLLVAAIAVVATPAVAVESMYLDSVPITKPGEYLAPADLYLLVPPPSVSLWPGATLTPASLYDLNVTKPYDTVTTASNSTQYAAYAPSATETETETQGDEKLRVLLRAGLDHASDVPLAVIREHLTEVENIELVGEADYHDVLVEVETMKLDPSATVFVVVNAYKEVGGESLIFYNTFGYLGELKVLSGSAGYATKLETALQQEAERLQQEAERLLE